MNISNYAEKLRDARWQEKRAKILARDSWHCQLCDFHPAADRPPLDLRTHLEVHHLYYVAGREPWEYPRHALITLCNVCHENETRNPTLTGNPNSDPMRWCTCVKCMRSFEEELGPITLAWSL